MQRWPGIFRTLLKGIIQSYSGTLRTLCNACTCRNLPHWESWNILNSSINASQAYSEPCHICENLQIFKTLTYLKPGTYSDLSQGIKIKFFVEIVKNYNYFSKALHLRSFTGFWISLSLNKYSLTWRVTSSYVLSDTYSDRCLLS